MQTTDNVCKAFLHLLLRISESVTRLESLLLIVPPDDAATSDMKTLSLSKPTTGADEDSIDERYFQSCILFEILILNAKTEAEAIKRNI